MRMSLLLALAAAFPGCAHDPLPGGTTAFRAELFTGEWVGTWTNRTANTSGPASFLVSLPAPDTLSVVVDLGGDVFGAGDPPAQEFLLDIRGSAAFLDPQSSPTFGQVQGRLDGDGTVTLDGRGVPIGNVSEFSLTGEWFAAEIDLDTTIVYRPGNQPETAQASLRLSKV